LVASFLCNVFVWARKKENKRKTTSKKMAKFVGVPLYLAQEHVTANQWEAEGRRVGACL
jgi:hypothetical protein